MNEKLFEKLIKMAESETLDFKQEFNFALDNANDMEKKAKDSSFVKDILSFANTPRKINETSYIIIGIKDKTKDLIGINNIIDEAKLQQKVSSKTYPVPYFKYYTFGYNNKLFGIVEIPVKKYELPCKPTITIYASGGIEKNQVYFRRRDSNDVANYEEQVKIQKWLDSLPQNTEKLVIDRRKWFQKKRYIFSLLFGIFLMISFAYVYYNYNNIDFFLKKGEEEFNKENYFEAVTNLNRGIEWASWLKIEWDLTEDECEKCREKLEYFAHFYEIRFKSYIKLNQFDKAIDDIYNCIYLSKNDLKYEILLGDLYITATSFNDATITYAKILEEDLPKEEYYYVKFKQGVCYFLLSKDLQDIDKFKNLCEKFVKNMLEISQKTDLLMDFKYKYFSDFEDRTYYKEISGLIEKILNNSQLSIVRDKLSGDFKLN